VIFTLPNAEAAEVLVSGWAGPGGAFVKLQRSIAKHRLAILASIEHGPSNGRAKSMNTKIRLVTRIAFSFKSPDALIALIALAILSSGRHKPVLPGRNSSTEQTGEPITTQL